MIYSLLFQKSFNQVSVPKSLAKNKVSTRITASNAYNNLKMMPIGVPKVAYRVPGSPSADWVDIYNRLYRERIIFLGQEIDDEIANQIIAVMLYLDSEDNSKPIYLYINSPGGSVISGLAMYDTMKHIKSEVVTINVGLAASMSSFILAAGQKGKRLALPHSRVMIHQPMGGAQGQASDIEVEAQQILRIRKSLTEDYAEMSGRPYEKVLQDMDRDNFMSSYEAAEYGLVDRVIEGKAN
jgi:ATP-dependent Clp endopeptidase proteolytic subunit ClpP